MGLGSESMVTQYHHQQHHQHLKSCPTAKTDKKANHGKSSKGGWFYDQLKKSAVLASENGKSDHHSNQSAKKPAKKQTLNPTVITASYPQYHAKSKPIPVKGSISQNEVGGMISTKSVTYGGKQHQLPRNSPINAMLVQTPQRPSSMTPPSVTPQTTPGKFYAGARFETHPSSIALPLPPTHWTTPIQRSHSQPSTPTIKNCTPIDLASLFGSPSTNPVTVNVAKSFPGERRVQSQALEKKQAIESDSDEELKDILSKGTKKAVIKKEVVPLAAIATASPRHAVNTNDLKKALGMVTVNSPSAPIPVTPKTAKLESLNLTCHGSVTPLNNFKEMSDQLKSLMKVAA